MFGDGGGTDGGDVDAGGEQGFRRFQRRLRGLDDDRDDRAWGVGYVKAHAVECGMEIRSIVPEPRSTFGFMLNDPNGRGRGGGYGRRRGGGVEKGFRGIDEVVS